jgi:hypothetical protein
VSESPLSRIAGPVAVTAGALFAAAHLGLFATVDRGDPIAMISDPVFRAFNIAFAAMFPLLLFALFAVYLRQDRAAGAFGLIGLFGAMLGTMSLGADMWFEAFAAPWVVAVAPQLLTAEKAVIWQVGYQSAYVLFALGWVLFGLSSLRARVFPVAISLALVVGGLIGYLAAMPPFGVPLGLAVAALGAWLIRTDRAARRQRPSAPSIPG